MAMLSRYERWGEVKAETVCAMPLATAYLCVDCGFVGSQSKCCVKCTSRSVMGLSGILDREDQSLRLPDSLRRFLEGEAKDA